MVNIKGMSNDNLDEELTFIELIKVIVAYRFIIIGVATASILFSGLYAIIATPTYRSEVIIAAASDSSSTGGLSSIMSSLGGMIPGMGGLSRMGQRDKLQQGIATLRSPQFTIKFINDLNLMPVLFAAKWDPEAKDWYEGSPEAIPTLQDGAILFNENISKIIEQDNGLVTLSIEWKDRYQAAEWANDLIRRLNDRLRKKTIDEANQTIEYLNKEVEKTRIVELQQAIYFMIENQINLRTMANVQKEFAFQVISPAIPSDQDRYFKPKRMFIVIIGAILGVFFGVFLSFLLFAFKRIRKDMSAS